MGRNAGGVRGGSAKYNFEDVAEDKIKAIISDIKNQGFSRKQPFNIGKVELRMERFAGDNKIELGSNDMYMSSRSIAHSLRDSKTAKGLTVSEEDLANFPKNRKTMKLYYNTMDKGFVYTDGRNKFIVKPNFEIKLSGGKSKVVNFITATKMKDDNEFKMRKYIKI